MERSHATCGQASLTTTRQLSPESETSAVDFAGLRALLEETQARYLHTTIHARAEKKFLPQTLKFYRSEACSLSKKNEKTCALNH